MLALSSLLFIVIVHCLLFIVNVQCCNNIVGGLVLREHCPRRQTAVKPFQSPVWPRQPSPLASQPVLSRFSSPSTCVPLAIRPCLDYHILNPARPPHNASPKDAEMPYLSKSRPATPWTPPPDPLCLLKHLYLLAGKFFSVDAMHGKGLLLLDMIYVGDWKIVMYRQEFKQWLNLASFQSIN